MMQEQGKGRAGEETLQGEQQGAALGALGFMEETCPAQGTASHIQSKKKQRRARIILVLFDMDSHFYFS